MRRAFTLLETLLSLVILGAVAGALVSWLTTSSAAAAASGGAAAWEVSARQALDLVGEDLLSFDQQRNEAGGSGTRQAGEPRVLVESGAVLIRSRVPLAGEEQTQRYELRGGRLYRGAVLIAENVDTFDVELDEETRILLVSITGSMGGRTMSRRYRAP